MTEIQAIMASHNRRALTLSAVRGAYSAAESAGLHLTLTVLDDGSTDGTAEALRASEFPVNVLEGTGDFFWARSMAVAEAEALANRTIDTRYVVWLNDDVSLDEDAFVRLTRVSEEAPGAVVVGAMRDSADSSVITYSGFRRSGLHPLSLEIVPPSSEVKEVDTFNGNLVLVPVETALRLGGIDGSFAHGLADIDYGLRCKAAGLRAVLAPGTYGVCDRNPSPPSLSLLQEWRRFLTPKGGGHYDSMKRVLRKSSRRTWPLYVAATYILWWARSLIRHAARVVND